MTSMKDLKKSIVIPISLVLALALVSGILLSFTRGFSFQHTSSSTPVVNCGPGIPAEKCNPQLAPPLKPLPTVHPKPKSPAPIGPQGTFCGRGFFIPQQFSEMERQFGSISCFGVGDQWIVVGEGQQINPSTLPPPPTQGGAIIAVETCSSGDATCLNPNTPHNFSAFTVSYPPDPTSGSLQVETTDPDHLIGLILGHCGIFSFSTSTRSWYKTTPNLVSELSSGKNVPAPVAAPPSVPGSTALSSTAPIGDPQSCQV